MPTEGQAVNLDEQLELQKIIYMEIKAQKKADEAMRRYENRKNFSAFQKHRDQARQNSWLGREYVRNKRKLVSVGSLQSKKSKKSKHPQKNTLQTKKPKTKPTTIEFEDPKPTGMEIEQEETTKPLIQKSQKDR